ncbi:hypothetical protein PHMEG_00032951, partial [Phytophthora megakarya]
YPNTKKMLGVRPIRWDVGQVNQAACNFCERFGREDKLKQEPFGGLLRSANAKRIKRSH